MSGDANPPSEKANEDTIQVVGRVRPLNDAEERSNSKFIVSFKANDDQQISIGVSSSFIYHLTLFFSAFKLNGTLEVIFQKFDLSFGI